VFSHLVLTYDGVTLRFFVNGVPASPPFVTTIDMRENDAPLVLGALSTSGNVWKGDLDEMAIYAHALAEERILAHYGRGTGR
jgi:hypothetical protein